MRKWDIVEWGIVESVAHNAATRQWLESFHALSPCGQYHFSYPSRAEAQKRCAEENAKAIARPPAQKPDTAINSPPMVPRGFRQRNHNQRPAAFEESSPSLQSHSG